MPTTSNYSWPTPADTDYVKDGAAAMRSLGNAADTTVKSVSDVANAAIPKSTVTTNGDLIRGTGSGTVTRIAPGTDGQILKIVAGVPAWSNAATGDPSWTLISSSTSTAAAITFSGLSSAYTRFRIVIARVTNSGGRTCSIVLNNDTSTGLYASHALTVGTTFNLYPRGSTGGFRSTSSTAATAWWGDLQIYSANQTGFKSIDGWLHDGSGIGGTLQGIWNDTTAVNRIDVVFSGTNSTNTGIYLYGA